MAVFFKIRGFCYLIDNTQYNLFNFFYCILLLKINFLKILIKILKKNNSNQNAYYN